MIDLHSHILPALCDGSQDLETSLAMARIAKGEDAVQVMQEFSYRLTQKLLHPTSILLREAAKGDEPECFEFMQENLAATAKRRRK